MRADIYLTEKGIAKSRSKAKAMIEEGVVYAGGIKITKASQELNCEEVEIRGEILPYVSRGGLKLKAAIDGFGLDVKGLICLDIGASTGGFTDCLLQHDAVKVYAVDCGHGQLDKAIAQDPRVISIEGQNARELDRSIIPEKISFCVMDLSFISQTLIHPVLPALLSEGAILVTLIKPQFEAGRSNIGKNGIVRSVKAREEAVRRVLDSLYANGFELAGKIESPIKGGDGNTEYLGILRFKNKRS